ncbi:MAG: hypothetical protein GY938_25620, partial [Ketobacter sp.]|nr:hypothetical protein [Ketobacter sp.]
METAHTRSTVSFDPLLDSTSAISPILPSKKSSGISGTAERNDFDSDLSDSDSESESGSGSEQSEHSGTGVQISSDPNIPMSFYSLGPVDDPIHYYVFHRIKDAYNVIPDLHLKLIRHDLFPYQDDEAIPYTQTKLNAFTPDDLRFWAEQTGQKEVFIGQNQFYAQHVPLNNNDPTYLNWIKQEMLKPDHKPNLRIILWRPAVIRVTDETGAANLQNTDENYIAVRVSDLCSYFRDYDELHWIFTEYLKILPQLPFTPTSQLGGLVADVLTNYRCEYFGRTFVRPTTRPIPFDTHFNPHRTMCIASLNCKASNYKVYVRVTNAQEQLYNDGNVEWQMLDLNYDLVKYFRVNEKVCRWANQDPNRYSFIFPVASDSSSNTVDRRQHYGYFMDENIQQSSTDNPYIFIPRFPMEYCDITPTHAFFREEIRAIPNRISPADDIRQHMDSEFLEEIGWNVDVYGIQNRRIWEANSKV